MTLSDLEKIWAAHQKKYPGDYRVYEAANSTHNDIWRAWVREKHRINVLIDMERANMAPPEIDFNPGLPRSKREQQRHDRLSAESYRQNYLDCLAILNELSPEDPMWNRQRGKASNYRFRALERAERDGIAMWLPDIPQRPPKRKQKGHHADNR